ncbi:MAG: FAD-dependent oxidoreductase [Clostridia bacterium]|nr:FAD-dependent oxidoreductase [Clostridia bacterium]
MKNYVIIGNGTAAAGCIEGIRTTDKEGKITVISAESRPVYCRPLISYYLEGKTTVEKMSYRPADFYEANGAEVLYGKRAVKADTEAHTVELDDGSVVSYDELALATGSSPFVPPFAGLDTVKNKYSFMTLDDTLALEKAITPDCRVLIAGAGLIGLKCAEGLRDRVGKITVFDLAGRVLSSILDDECASIVQKHLEDSGITVLTGDTASEFRGNTAVMKSGRVIDFDVLVLAVGVRAGIGIAKDAGIACGRGITVDNTMKTSADSVYAVGDCTESPDISSGAVKVMAIMPNAYMQGRTAGINMAGGSASLDNAFPMNSIGFFGLHMMTAGSYDGEMSEEKTGTSLKRFFVKDGRLSGFILIGDTTRAGIFTAMIRNKTPTNSVDFELMKKSATNAGFSSEKRRKMYGSVV